MSRYAVVGDPIAHSKSPEIHSQFARQTGEDVSYDKHQVSAGEFEQFVRTFFAEGGSGLNITLPHKESAFNLAAVKSTRSQLAKAANTLWLNDQDELCAENTDGAGIVRDLTVNHDVQLSDRRLLIVGAGGAARGALATLIETNPSAIAVLNRTRQKAEAIAGDFAGKFDLQVLDYESQGDGDFDVIINATSMGIQDKAPPINAQLIGKECCCYDMMYGDEPTAFMRWASDNDAKIVIDGLGMLVEQAAESFRIWRGVRPQTQPVIDALR